jgi:hypothetical protein
MVNTLNEHMHTCRAVGVAPAAALYTWRNQLLLFARQLFYSCPATARRDDLFLLLLMCAGVETISGLQSWHTSTL